MTTADYALIVSLFSAAVALASLFWNVYSKFIHPKPEIRVGFSRMTIHQLGSSRHGDKLLMVTATNRGPGSVVIERVVVCKRWRWQREIIGVLNPIEDPGRKPYVSPRGPASGGLPKKLDVGESHDLYFPPDAEFVMPDQLEDHPYIGVSHSFRRLHLTKITPPFDPLRPVGTPLSRSLWWIEKKRMTSRRWIRSHLTLRRQRS